LAKKGTTRSILATPLFDLVAPAWVAHGLYPFVLSHDPIQTVSNFLKLRSMNHMFRQAIAVLKCNCASFIILGFQRAASDGPAGREMGIGPIVKRETVIVLVNASAAVPARGKGRMIG
jgi:hypothetical protein